MAASSFSNVLTVPFSKTYEAGSLGLRPPKFRTAPSPLTPKQKSIKVQVKRDTIIGELVREQEHEEATLRHEKYKAKGLPEVWREIHGEKDWAGLLEPMDPLLRTEVIRYGEMAQACYDGFDGDAFSKYCGSCRFARGNYFSSLGMSHHGYTITRYLHVTANIKLPKFFKHTRWSKLWSKTNWAGYVAVSDEATSRRLGRRDITIAWRGTVSGVEWVVDLMDILKPISSKGVPCPDPTVKVEWGFLELYTDKDESYSHCKYSAREQMLTEVKRLLEMYHDEEVSITITGHSLGSALAILSAYDIAETGLINVVSHSKGKGVPVSVMSFSGPRVGNVRFKERLERLGVKVLRVLNVHDSVPKVPGVLFNDLPSSMMHLAEGLPWSYSHVGVELALDHNKSPFLNPNAGVSCAHNLEALLHLLDGYHGKGQRFLSGSGRDPALVNKGCDFLIDDLMIPPNWRQDENRGLTRSNDGHWMQPERPKLDDHPQDMHIHLTQLRLASSDIYVSI